MRAAVGRPFGAVAAAAALSLAACGGDDLPAVTVTAVPTAATEPCRRFAAALPADLGEDVPRRDTSPADPHVAAYGDPPIVVRCGVPPPAGYEQGDPLLDVNGVDWFYEEHPEFVVWTTPRSFVNVEVTVPRAWSGDRLARLAEAVKALR